MRWVSDKALTKFVSASQFGDDDYHFQLGFHLRPFQLPFSNLRPSLPESSRRIQAGLAVVIGNVNLKHQPMSSRRAAPGLDASPHDPGRPVSPKCTSPGILIFYGKLE